jgi:hypothetical protein
MTKRQAPEIASRAPAPNPVDHPPSDIGPAGAEHTLAADIRQYGADLELRYVAARNAWTLAMRVANSGRSKDLASLAIAQQAYEEVAAERENWLAGGRMAIPVEPDTERHHIEVAVGQELEWRKVLHPPTSRGFLARIKGRLTGR